MASGPALLVCVVCSPVLPRQLHRPQADVCRWHPCCLRTLRPLRSRTRWLSPMVVGEGTSQPRLTSTIARGPSSRGYQWRRSTSCVEIRAASQRPQTSSTTLATTSLQDLESPRKADQSALRLVVAGTPSAGERWHLARALSRGTGPAPR